MPRPWYISTLARRHSLRWRLPLVFSALALLMLIPFLWLTFRTIQGALEEAASQRANLAATQISELLVTSLDRLSVRGAELQEDPEIQAFLRSPDEARREPLSGSLETDVSAPFRRVEVWSNNGELVFARSNPGVIDSGGPVVDFPVGARPVRSGVSDLQTNGKLIYFDVVTEIRDSADRGGDSHARRKRCGHPHRRGGRGHLDRFRGTRRCPSVA